MNDLERMIRANFRIWVHPSKHSSKLYKYIVYGPENEAEAQFKKREHAELYMEERVQVCLDKIKDSAIMDILSGGK